MVGGRAILRDQLLLRLLTFFCGFAHEIRSYASVLLNASCEEYLTQGRPRRPRYLPCSASNANARLPTALECCVTETS